jgi:hypothetical protein
VRGVAVGAALVLALAPLHATRATATSWSVTLTASPTDPQPGEPVVLVAVANADVSATPYYIDIYDTTVGRRVAVCGTGRTCTGIAGHDGETARRYVAYLDTFSTGYPPPGVVATSNPVDVRWAYPVSVGSVVTFDGVADLPRFPCPPPPPYGTGPCTGTVTGSTSGHLAGTAHLDAYDVTWTGATGGVKATFSSSEWLCEAGLENVLGTANGTGLAQAASGVVGWYRVAGDAVARPVTAVTARFAFEWERVGATAVVTFTSFDVTLSVAGLGDRLVVTGGRTGAATFVLTNTANVTAPTCDDPLTGVHGQIAGSVPVT